MPIRLPSVPPVSFDSSAPGRDLCRGNSSAARGSERKSRRYTPYDREGHREIVLSVTMPTEERLIDIIPGNLFNCQSTIVYSLPLYRPRESGLTYAA
jgi:hypothetical protein